MANPAWLTLNGSRQGLISAGAGARSSIGNKAQLSHFDEIMILAINHSMTRVQNVNHQSLDIRKPIDKATPLLTAAINDNEELNCVICFWRTNRAGMNEVYFKITLIKSRIAKVSLILPHVISQPAGQPEEVVSFTYESITQEHTMASTSAYSFWEERIM